MANKNEQIALKRGWTKLDQGDTWFINPLGQWHKCVPDFEHDWKHAGPLLEELIGADQQSEGDDIILGLGGWLTINEEMFESDTDTLTGAIACAWLAWKRKD